MDNIVKGEIIQVKIEDVPCRHRNQHEDFEFFRRDLIREGGAKQCAVEASHSFFGNV